MLKEEHHCFFSALIFPAVICMSSAEGEVVNIFDLTLIDLACGAQAVTQRNDPVGQLICMNEVLKCSHFVPKVVRCHLIYSLHFYIFAFHKIYDCVVVEPRNSCCRLIPLMLTFDGHRFDDGSFIHLLTKICYDSGKSGS